MKVFSKKILVKLGMLIFVQNIFVFFRLNKRKIYNKFFSTAKILLYHRVSKTDSDPYLLSVSPENFREQLLYLSTNFNVISLVDMVRKIKEHKVESNDVVITFDDGYADNFYNALPILKELNIPATIFVTAGKIDSTSPFFWDNIVEGSDRGRPLTRSELQNLAENSLIEIGAHTMSHIHLKDHPLDVQSKEILESKTVLENIINKKVVSFAYPFGWPTDYDSNTVCLVKKAGYDYACVVEGKRVSNFTDKYTIPRFVVRNWSREEFIENFKIFV